MKWCWWLLIGLALGACGGGGGMGEWTLKSPDGAATIAVRLTGAGGLQYRVEAFGEPVLSWSDMGVVRSDSDLSTGLSVVEATEISTVDEDVELLHGKRVRGRLRANQQTLTLRNASGQHLDLVLLAADDGLAFRYRFPDTNPAEVQVVEEVTSFALAQDGRAWLQPTQVAGHFAPAYENLFSNAVPIGIAAPVASWNFPALFELGGTWALLTEADLDAGYFGGHIDNPGGGRTYRVVLPQVAEGNGVGHREPVHPLPWELPWRLIVVGETAGAVAETDLVPALARRPQGNFGWVTPGRVSWSWWSEHTSPRDLDRMRDYIDLAAEFGWEYTLVDANWNVHADTAMAELVEYARRRGVGVFLWYNSGGPNNDVTEQPRDRMYDPQIRRAEMDKIAGWGVAGIKVDFFHSDKQSAIGLYLDIARDAADRRLMVNFHGSTIPRGWPRTWPNIMTMEGVRGAEQYGFDPDYPSAAPWHNTVLAFTRNVVGPMDYTPVTFGDQHFPHVTTNAHELALAVVFESGLQHMADSAASYRALLPGVAELLRDVPVVWEETRFLSGEPGDHAVVARRSGDEWWIAGINGRREEQAAQIPASLVAGMTLHLVSDGSGPRRFAESRRALRGSEALTVEMAPGGGFLARLTPPD